MLNPKATKLPNRRALRAEAKRKAAEAKAARAKKIAEDNAAHLLRLKESENLRAKSLTKGVPVKIAGTDLKCHLPFKEGQPPPKVLIMSKPGISTKGNPTLVPTNVPVVIQGTLTGGGLQHYVIKTAKVAPTPSKSINVKDVAPQGLVLSPNNVLSLPTASTSVQTLNISPTAATATADKLNTSHMVKLVKPVSTKYSNILPRKIVSSSRISVTPKPLGQASGDTGSITTTAPVAADTNSTLTHDSNTVLSGNLDAPVTSTITAASSGQTAAPAIITTAATSTSAQSSTTETRLLCITGTGDQTVISIKENPGWKSYESSKQFQ